MGIPFVMLLTIVEIALVLKSLLQTVDLVAYLMVYLSCGFVIRKNDFITFIEHDETLRYNS
jgi:hypothetical protein